MGAYASCQVAGFVCAAAAAILLGGYRGLDRRRLALTMLLAVGAALVGGRVAKACADLPAVSADPSLLYRCSIGGFDLLGAILGSSLVAVGVAARLRLPVRILADCAAPGLGLAIAIQRVGCISAGCCFGRPTSVPWAIHVEPFGKAHSAQISAGLVGLFDGPLAVHPSQLYELAAALLAAAVSYLAWRRARAGEAIGAFAAVFFAAKIGITFTRFPDAAGDPPWLHLAAYAALAVGGAFLVRRARRGAPAE